MKKKAALVVFAPGPSPFAFCSYGMMSVWPGLILGVPFVE